MLFFKSNDHHKIDYNWKAHLKKMVKNLSILIFLNPKPRLEYSKIIKERERERRMENESHKIFHHFHGVNSWNV